MPRPPEPVPGTVIGGRYQLIEVAGRGGMADVWRGQVLGDHGFTRVVAIKQMHTALAEKPAYVTMFIEEARLGAALDSPNLAEARDFVTEDGNYYMVMEWVEGVDLGSWVKWHVDRGELTRWELVAATGIGILRGLAAAHERLGPDGRPMPVVHRDVSPHNVLLTNRGMVKLIDFGLALAVDRSEETTDPGVVKGKMAYLSPEIVAGGRPVPSSDLFAAAAVMWEALVGRKLFDGGTDLETYKRVRDCVVQPLRPSRPDVPAQFGTLLARALAADPAARFPSAREFARQLSTVLKKSTMRKDLHTALSRSVADARGGLGLGLRTGDPASSTPVVDVRDVTPPIEDRRGLWHRLPFVGRRR
ncbi:MAG: serine/threonine protein kinase [Kofleriaceae bacterium]|nr:serine/threonine protein kinase [Myxococcales bacterium]MCB9560505.1 serine/threonine protein kinase [Kofleriaceae bacterium]MCB9575203.1 serine/threonine protein kinase [Kofleriaceae bacterium]